MLRPLDFRYWMNRRVIQVGLDLATLIIAFMSAWLLRFDFAISPQQQPYLGAQLLLVTSVQFIALYSAGAYRLVWRHFSLADLPVLLRSLAYSAVPILALRLMPLSFLEPYRIPLSVILLDGVLAFGGVVAVRVVRRAVYENKGWRSRDAGGSDSTKRVLLVGAGAAGALAARELTRRGSDLVPIGFVDDDPLKKSSVIHGIEVLGAVGDIATLVREHKVDDVVITIATIDDDSLRRVVGICDEIPVKVRRIPKFQDLIHDRASIIGIRDVLIDELLGRDTVELDETDLERFLGSKSIMVTGAGGSIGSELAMQVARFQPRHLFIVERAEYALFTIDRRVRELWPDLNIVPVVADVGDLDRMRSAFAYRPPQVVLHAAAHKHVSLMEANPTEAIRNNTLATETLGKLVEVPAEVRPDSYARRVVEPNEGHGVVDTHKILFAVARKVG